ncbi:MAG: DinB family protein [Saprospiraceae bacterium]|nr:DinB family protein [Saprospiraceae bacterium]
MPEYYDRYINLIPDINLITALSEYGDNLFNDKFDQLILLDSRTYAPGKWTVKDILQHLIDTERVFLYRALRFARQDDTILSSFDENVFAQNAMAETRGLESLIHEFSVVRQSAICFFESLREDDIRRVGTAAGKNISVLAIGFTIAGHGLHHMNILEERYFPLLNS